MLSVLVIIVAITARVAADYQYNAPQQSYQNGNVNLGSMQPTYAAPSRHADINSNQDKSVVYSVTYKDYYYVGNGNGQGRQQHLSANQVTPSGYNYNANNVNFAQQTEPSTLLVPPSDNVNYNSHHKINPAQTAMPIVNNNQHHMQVDRTPWIPITNNNWNNQITSGQSNLGAPSSGINYNNQAQTTMENSNYYNGNAANSQSYIHQVTGYPQRVPSQSVSTQNGYSQTPAQLSNINQNGYVQNAGNYPISLNNDFMPKYNAPVTVSDNYAQVSIASGHNQNVGYSQSANVHPQTTEGTSNNAYSQTLTSTAPFNSYYAQSLSSNDASSSNGYPYQTNSHNNNIVQTSPLQANLNVASSGSSSLNSNYVQGSSLSGGNLNAGVVSTSSSYNAPLNSDSVQINFNSNIGNVGSQGSQASSNTPALPRIVKHIYFHIPPPEPQEQKSVPPPSPPKKNYKIIFIKVPSQQSKANLARLQQIAQQQSAIEEKTLIYVLAKKPDTQDSIVLPTKEPSKHEVFFVKYNGDPLEFASKVSDGLGKTDAVQNFPNLQPGLTNGK